MLIPCFYNACTVSQAVYLSTLSFPQYANDFVLQGAPREQENGTDTSMAEEDVSVNLV